jgi:hypothetical protein
MTLHDLVAGLRGVVRESEESVGVQVRELLVVPLILIVLQLRAMLAAWNGPVWPRVSQMSIFTPCPERMV